jgi:hypothetical protein
VRGIIKPGRTVEKYEIVFRAQLFRYPGQGPKIIVQDPGEFNFVRGVPNESRDIKQPRQSCIRRQNGSVKGRLSFQHFEKAYGRLREIQPEAFPQAALRIQLNEKDFALNGRETRPEVHRSGRLPYAAFLAIT